MMQLNKLHITTFNHPNFGEMATVIDGSNNISDSRYLMNVNIHPYDVHETMVYKSTIACLIEENKQLKKRVRKLTQVYG